jgi:hypothetical protein
MNPFVDKNTKIDSPEFARRVGKLMEQYLSY